MMNGFDRSARARSSWYSRSGHTILSAVFTACLLPMAGHGQAPEPSSPPPLIAPPSFRANGDSSIDDLTTEDPYWRETVDRALEQLQSENPEVRRSAVMLLGKYPVPPAREAVSDALTDDHASVRRAALVSLLEEQAPVTPKLGARLLRLLSDPDVSIRRIASTAAHMSVQHFTMTLLPGQNQPRRDLPAEAKEQLRRAFVDEDVTVRRNMVSHYPFLRVDLPQETVVKLLHDPDDEVAIQALRWGLPLLDSRTLAREIERLLDHENDLYRLELAKALQNHPIREARAALEVLQTDEHPAVAIEAMLAAFYHRPDAEIYQQILERYRESGGRADSAQRIIFAAQMLGQEGNGYLEEWLKDPNPAHRQYAAQAFLGRPNTNVSMKFLLSLLEDSAPGVRQQAMQAMMRANQRLAPEHVRTAAASPHADVRRMAAGLSNFLPADAAEEVLMDLLLDEVTEVRLAALHQIGNRRVPGWEEIMALSLDEEDQAIQRAALEWIVRQPNPEAIRLLRAYVERQPHSPLRPRIELFLRQQETADRT